jgi:AraC-like DNA-binding protein
MNSQLTPLPTRTAGLQKELAAKLRRYAPSHGLHLLPVAGVSVARSNSPSQPLASVYEPSLCMVMQGRKRAVVGDEMYVYDPLNYLVVSVTLPALSHIIEATPREPYLCLRIEVDAAIIAELLEQLGPEVVARPTCGRGVFVAEMSPSLLDAVSRLVSLFSRPDEASVLAPLVLKEIHYRVLKGTLGSRLRDLCTADSHANRIARVIRLLKSGYTNPVRIEELAAAAHMSVSSLHHRFKEVTALSPIQYLKQLRLHEARRLMFTEGLDAAAACYRVGYESPSQFSREYRRLFGAPPRREVERLRGSRDPPAEVVIEAERTRKWRPGAE